VEVGETVAGLVNRINDIISTREKYESTPLVDMKEYSELGSSEELFDSIVVLENYPLNQGLKQEDNQLPLVAEFDSIIETTTYDLNVGILIADDIGINFIYHKALFEEESIRRLSHHFINIVTNIIKNPGNEVEGLEILSPEEKKQVLYDFNDSEAAYPQNKTIHGLLSEQAELTPDHTALVESHEKIEGTRGLATLPTPISITYRELNEKSDRLAYLLIEKGIESDSIVGFMMNRSVEMVIGILGILKAGGAYLPIDPGYPPERVNLMLADSEAEVLLFDNFSCPRCPSGLFPAPKVLLNLSAGQQFDFHPSTLLPFHPSNPATLAYIMYTSGSTGRPKGVMVEHRNVVRLVVNTNYIELTGETRLLQTGAPVFDATTFEIWGTLLNGGQLVLVEKEVIPDALQLGKAIEKNKINTLWLTSPLFNQLARENCDIFSNLDYLLVGGDVLSPRFINLARSKSEKLKIINGYGPTENTTFSTTFLIERDFEESIPIGSPITNSTAFVLNQYGGLQPVGVFGELWVGGDGVSRGYLNSPELSGEKFVKDTLIKGKRLYRTGDITRWLPGGNIEFSGRIDDQVKMRGFRIELEEIELALLAHPEIKASAVMVREPKINAPAGEKGEPYLCAYVVPHPGKTHSSSLDTPYLHHYLAGKLPGYMIPAYFEIVEHLPLTSNGKLDRKALPEPKLNLIHQYIPPGNNREERLVGIFSQILEIEKEKIGIDANFFELGGHSLKATRLINRIHKEFGIRLDLAECLKTPTIRQISGHLQSSAGDDGVTPLMPVEEKEYYTLSSAQERLYTLQKMDRENVAYNIFCSRVFDGKINREKLEWAFRQLIHRHESLRTSFVIIDGQIVQRIHPEVTFAFECCSLPIKHFIRPFDLSQAPLLRVGLVTHEDKKLTLLIDIHHIITDGVSQAVLIKELIGLCQGETLPSPRLRYKDFSRWQQQWKKEEYKRQEAFWLEEFQDKIPRLNMPTDFPRPEVQSFEGDILIFEVNKNEADALKKMAREESVTLFMLLLAVYYVFLAGVSHQEDIVVGVPTVGRRYADLDNIIGMFVNTLALRNFPQGEITFRKLLKNVKTRTLRAFENQDYQFDDLVERLLSTRDARRNPIFDVMFTFNDWKDEAYDLNLENILNKTARFDLILHTFEKNETFYFAFEYSTRLYKKETIERFVVYFKKILSSVMENPDKNISGIEIISDEEKNRLIRGIKNKDEKSAILMEHAVRNKAKGQKQTTNLTADFDF
jgi:amino acid adenylation domain-containing protein